MIFRFSSGAEARIADCSFYFSPILRAPFEYHGMDGKIGVFEAGCPIFLRLANEGGYLFYFLKKGGFWTPGAVVHYNRLCGRCADPESFLCVGFIPDADAFSAFLLSLPAIRLRASTALKPRAF